MSETQLEFERRNTAAYGMLKEMPLLKVTYFDYGVGVNHNMPCAVYPETESAVLSSPGVFKPSRKAQAEGWVLLQPETRFQAWLLKKFFGVDLGTRKLLYCGHSRWKPN